MNTLKKSILATVSASALMLSLAMPAMATWSQPDYSDVTSSLVSIPATVTALTTVVAPIKLEKIKIVYIEDVLNTNQINIVKNSLNGLSLNILSLHNVLQTVKVANGSSILTFGDVLSNNKVPVSDVISLRNFNDGGILVFCKH